MSDLFPALKSGTAFAIFKSSGKIPSFKVALAREERIEDNIGDDSLIKKQEMLSYPADLLTFNTVLRGGASRAQGGQNISRGQLLSCSPTFRAYGCKLS